MANSQEIASNKTGRKTGPGGVKRAEGPVNQGHYRPYRPVQKGKDQMLDLDVRATVSSCIIFSVVTTTLISRVLIRPKT